MHGMNIKIKITRESICWQCEITGYREMPGGHLKCSFEAAVRVCHWPKCAWQVNSFVRMMLGFAFWKCRDRILA